MTEFPNDLNQASSDRPRQGDLFDVIFSIIVILASGFSGYTTFLGFSYDVPFGLAATLAVIIGLALVAINFRLRQERREGGPIGGALLAFFFIFIFSFISNTNAIYTFFVSGDIIENTQEIAWRVFDEQSQIMLSNIDESDELTEVDQRERRLAIARRNLSEQIQDERNPGLGAIAKGHLSEVEEILGTVVTSLRAPPVGAPSSEFREYARRLDQLIQEQADSNITEPVAPLLELRSRIAQYRDLYGTTTAQKDYSSNAIDLMSRDLDAFGNELNAVLKTKNKFEKINDSADKTGSFQYTWTNFANWISPAAIILSVLLGALLDAIAPLLSLLLYRATNDLTR
jgi:hypothetical protein